MKKRGIFLAKFFSFLIVESLIRNRIQRAGFGERVRSDVKSQFPSWCCFISHGRRSSWSSTCGNTLGSPLPRHWRHLCPRVPTGSNLWRTMSRIRGTRRPPSRYRSPLLPPRLFLPLRFFTLLATLSSLFLFAQKTGSLRRQLSKESPLPDFRFYSRNRLRCIELIE